jgi:hypothetical protein
MAFSAVPTGFKPKNKLRRQAAYLNIKKNREAEKRDVRHRRKREEDKDPSLREERHATHVPVTIDSKRVWDDDAVGDEEDALGWAVDVERLAKRRKLEQEQAEADGGEEGVLAKLKKLEQEEAGGSDDEEKDEDADSMLESDSELEDFESDSDSDAASRKKSAKRATSPTASVATTSATNLELSPEFLKTKFPYVPPSSSLQSTQTLTFLPDNSSTPPRSPKSSSQPPSTAPCTPTPTSSPPSSPTANTCAAPPASKATSTRFARSPASRQTAGTRRSSSSCRPSTRRSRMGWISYTCPTDRTFTSRSRIGWTERNCHGMRTILVCALHM